MNFLFLPGPGLSQRSVFLNLSRHDEKLAVAPDKERKDRGGKEIKSHISIYFGTFSVYNEQFESITIDSFSI